MRADIVLYCSDLSSSAVLERSNSADFGNISQSRHNLKTLRLL